ncbi:MAG: hypothetical protein DRG78_23685 [Epsilonproteobacteria bacterium]|nr:MAG: hypothetical protein DRG78_23685 [Campylobacterota bacterium]
MNEMIIEAIKNKQLLAFIYNDKNRIVEPYTLGVSTKGNDTLSAYQIDGGSNSSKDLSWRQFIVPDIEQLKILDKSFEIIRDGYNPNSDKFDPVYATV